MSNKEEGRVFWTQNKDKIITNFFSNLKQKKKELVSTSLFALNLWDDTWLRYLPFNYHIMEIPGS